MSRFDCNRMVVRFTTTYAISVYHQVVILNPTQTIQHYVIMFVSDLQQVGDFLRAFRFPSPIKLTATI
jgi:hypothetical protein